MFNNPFIPYYNNFTTAQATPNPNNSILNGYSNTTQHSQYSQNTNNYGNQYNHFQTPLFKVRPVTSYEEVRASIIDNIDGNPNFFTDFNNGYIYVKAVNPQDGNAYINSYKIQPLTEVEKNASNQDIKTIISKVVELENNFNNIQQSFKQIQSEWSGLNDEPVSSNPTKQ